MKKSIKIILVILVVLALSLTGGWIYWQQHKKGLIKNSIQNAVNKGTDSLYFIHYDSSSIDEVNGNASFYNVDLQSDSLQKQLLEFDTASSATVFNVHIDEVSIKGANIPGLMNNTSVEAKSILIRHPVVYIIRAGKKEKTPFRSNDSLAIYEKLLGKFESIHAGEITIENGDLYFADKTGDPHTALKDIDIRLTNFRIDSTKDYQNILSYFIKDVVAKVREIRVQGENNQATFTDVEYNAPGKFIRLKKFQQKDKEQKLVFDINNTSINDLSTDSFILHQQLKAEELVSDGGMLTFYMKKKPKTNSIKEEIEIDNNYFDEAQLNKVTIGNTRVLIYDKVNPDNAPLILNNVKFDAVDIQKLHSGTNIKNLISATDWKLSADGFSFMSENKRYKMNVGPFEINNANSSMRIKNFTVKPMFTEEAFSRILKHQECLYNLEFNNIELSSIDTRLLLTEQRLEVLSATLQPIVKIYRDRTIAEDTTNKIGKSPHELIQKIKFPFSVKKIVVKNGMVAYTEKKGKAKLLGTASFKNINGTISNVTNIKDLIDKNNLLVLDVTTSFMGVSQLQTLWKLPLNTSNGAFEVSGVAGGFNGSSLNPLIEPLGMASIKKGYVNKLTFNLTGTDLGSKGSATLLYEDIQVELLKADSGDLKKKEFMSLVTNALFKDSNPQNGVVRTEEINYERDITKSFFSLLWRSIFSAIKKTVQKL